MGYAAIPYILAAASAGVQYQTQRSAAKKQEATLAQQIRQNAGRQKEASTAIDAAMQQRASEDAGQTRKATAEQYLHQVRAAQGNATSGLNQGGNVSEAYRQSAQDAALGIGDTAERTAELMARIDAPALQRQREGQQTGQLGIDLNDLAQRGRGQDFLHQLRLARIQPNPWGQLVATGLGIAAGYGQQAGWGQDSLASIRGKALLDADMAAKSQQLGRSLWSKPVW